jgi:hypothetical protein
MKPKVLHMKFHKKSDMRLKVGRSLVRKINENELG